MEHLNNQEKKLLQDIKEDAEAEVEEETATPIPPSTETATGTEEQPTHNGVF